MVAPAGHVATTVPPVGEDTHTVEYIDGELATERDTDELATERDTDVELLGERVDDCAATPRRNTNNATASISEEQVGSTLTRPPPRMKLRNKGKWTCVRKVQV